MAGKDIDLSPYLRAARIEADLVLMTIRDKGMKRFGKVFALSAFFISAAYFGVYLPPQNKISRLQREIDAARALSDVSAKYLDLRDQLAVVYGTLPQLKDQQQWLSNAMIESLQAENLTPEMFQPVVESESSGLIFQTSTVQLELKFNDLYRWLLRLESAKHLMHVYTLDVAKTATLPGLNIVSASVMTAIPKKRFN